MPELIPEPWRGFLEALDAIATGPVDFHCIGGFVVTKKFGFVRETRDIDVLSICPSNQQNDFLQKGAEGLELHKRHKVYLDVVTVMRFFPEDYDSRLTEMYPGQLKYIRLLAPDAYDLALMKLDRNQDRDIEDVKFLAGERLIISAELKQRYDSEMRPYVPMAERTLDITLRFWMEMIDEVQGKQTEQT
jgi:hypothetical protein